MSEPTKRDSTRRDMTRYVDHIQDVHLMIAESLDRVAEAKRLLAQPVFHILPDETSRPSRGRRPVTRVRPPH